MGKKKIKTNNKKCEHRFHFVRTFDNTFGITYVKDINGEEIHDANISCFVCEKCGLYKNVGMIFKEE